MITGRNVYTLCPLLCFFISLSSGNPRCAGCTNQLPTSNFKRAGLRESTWGRRAVQDTEPSYNARRVHLTTSPSTSLNARCVGVSPVGDMKVSTPRLALNPLALLLLLFFSPASADPAPVTTTDLTTTVAATDASGGGLGASYNEGLASEIVRLTEAAYCTQQLAAWSCKACQHFPGMRNVTVINGEKRNVRGFVGVDIGDDEASNRHTSTTRGPVPDDRRHLRGVEGDGGAGGAARNGKARIVITFSGTDPSSVKVCSWSAFTRRCISPVCDSSLVGEDESVMSADAGPTTHSNGGGLETSKQQCTRG